MSGQLDIIGLTADEVEAEARRSVASGAGLAKTLYKDAVLRARFEPEAHGLSARSAEAWRARFRLVLPAVVRTVGEESLMGDDTVKAVLAFQDGLEVECVRIPMGQGRYTLCVSSQVGCKMGCGFCETAKMGFIRNLSAAEIVAQLVVARAVLGWEIRNIVFMGMGEPLDNPEGVLQALRVMHDRFGLSYGQPRLTICTSGRVDGLKRLAELGFKRMDLSISLNAAFDHKRDVLMPVNRKYPLAELQQALIEHPRREKFIYAINYCLLPGFNDAPEDARAVAEFVAPLGRAVVNVIPYNPGTQPLTRAPTEDEVVGFLDQLREHGVLVQRRVTKGRSVMAACGQLGNLELRRHRSLPVAP
ncbi:MAG: 23S rRNA (adenine(2503)-C(2))-methyltransferase RlmN [Deltaproteobacteria bacterium]|nr:23S rRNA (adenine(2503)-C(2))-methyltransferase RlmN [Deltaproteobacteria bacterium]